MPKTETPPAFATARAQLLQDIAASDLDRLLRGLPDEIGRAFGAAEVRLYTKDPLTEELFCRLTVQDGVAEHRLPVDPSNVAGYAALTRERAYAWKKGPNLRKRYVAAFPIVQGDELVAVLEITHSEDDIPMDEPRLKMITEVIQAFASRWQTLAKTGVRSTPYDRLLRSGVLTFTALDAARKRAVQEARSVEAVLISEGLDRQQIGLSLAEHFECRFIESPASTRIDEDLLRRFTPEFLKTHAVLPVTRSGDVVEIAVANPRNLTLLDDVARTLGTRNLLVRVGIREDLLSALEAKCAAAPPPPPPAPAAEAATADKEKKPSTRRFVVETPPAEEPIQGGEHSLESEEDDSRAVQIVNDAIQEALKRNASDIHIEPATNGGLLVRMRVDGVCHDYTRVQERCARAVVSRIKIMSELDIAEHRLPQDGKIRIRNSNGRKLDLRVAVMPTAGGIEDVVLRLLPEFTAVQLDDLTMEPRTIEAFKKALDEPHGIFLCAGPTGSGKTTTLHAALGYLKRPDTKIWTAEDPVEITQDGLRQVQVNAKIGLTFERCLRSFLRCDPDIIMIGEIRDRETADAAIEASLTGHMVLSTLHTNSAPETITRLLDMELDPYTFGDTLLGVLAQRLVRRICPDCKELYRPPSEEFARLKAQYGDDAAFAKLVPEAGKLKLARGKGCGACFNTGYRGRLGIHELLVTNAEIRRLIHKRTESAKVREAALAGGMRLLKQDGVRKVIEGHTDLREVLSNCTERG